MPPPNRGTSWYCSTPEEIPKVPHWVIIHGNTCHCSDDGYGSSSSSPYVGYQAFTVEEEWKKAIGELAVPRYGGPNKFSAMHVMPAQITTTVTVNVDIGQQAR